ncbi:MAG: hypothetical protein HYU38_10685 [Candidatus Tectomicrobia bacterium]|nr:hypothetical protein [Candidatus Tectomicrobia bacterium]
MKRDVWKRKLGLIVAVGLLAVSVDPPQGARAMTLPEMLKASEIFTQVAQAALLFAANAKKQTDQANAEMDLQSQGRQGARPSPAEIQRAFGRIAGHLQAARAHLRQAKGQMSTLAAAYQGQLAKTRPGRAEPPKTESEEEKRILARYNEAYREGATRSERGYEQALHVLTQAEERFEALKKAQGAGNAPGN